MMMVYRREGEETDSLTTSFLQIPDAVQYSRQWDPENSDPLCTTVSETIHHQRT